MYEVESLVYLTFGPIILLLVWRVYKFHLRPTIRPEDPKELPYWIPCEIHKPFDLLRRSF